MEVSMEIFLIKKYIYIFFGKRKGIEPGKEREKEKGHLANSFTYGPPAFKS